MAMVYLREEATRFSSETDMDAMARPGD